MKLTEQIKRILSALLVLVLVISLVPLNASAADSEPTIVIAASDFQHSSGHSQTASIVSNILSVLQADYAQMDGFLFAGDYDYNYNDSVTGKAKLQETVLEAYPDVDTASMVWVQGNHDADNLVGSTLSSSGAHDAANYGVFVINEKDYMWYNNDEATIRNTASNLRSYLNAKRNEAYTKPIFVISHLPLHYCMRTLKGGNDGMHANYIFDVLNEAGEAGLNIIFMFGHNHSHGWDDYLGGSAIFLAPGDNINIAQNSTTVYKQETLHFTYMNAGYIGYYGNTGSGADTTLTMTVFEIASDSVTVKRYDANGQHNLKSAGAYGGEYPDNKYASPVYSADTSVVGTSYTLTLNTEVTPAGEDSGDSDDGTVEGRTYTRVTSASDLVSGEKYLLVYNGSYFMLPEVVEKTSSSTRKGFNLESTSACGDNTISGDYEAKEWVLTASGSGWLLGNGTQYAKLTSTSDMAITATLENPGDVFTVGGSENAFTFSNGSYVLNYNSRGLINGYASNPAAFWIYRMTSESDSTQSGGSAATVKQITKYDDLKENVGYLIVADEGSDITLTNQANGSGLLLSGDVTADNTHLWYLDLTNEYIRYGSPEGTNNYLKVTNGGASVGSSSNRVTEIADNGDGTFALYRSSYYMNRYGGSSSTKAAGYNQNNNGSKWKLYEVIAAHNYEAVVQEPTCTEGGYTTYTCTECGDSYVADETEALGHDYDAVVTEATCGKDGSKVYTCTACNDTYTETIPATGSHSYETVTVEATCTENGSVTTTCTVCGDSSVAVIEAKGHAYACVVTDATCGAEGKKVYTCSACGDSYTETIPATGSHSYETVTVEATCTENGSVTNTCSVCGNTQVEVIAAAGHKYVSSVTAATCTEQGYTTYTCETCGNTYTDSYTEAFGHTYDAVISATCTEAGFVVYTCETCGDSYNGEEVAALGHSYETTVVAPTCATSGYTTYVCATCGHTYTGDEVAALGHDYEATVMQPTCTEGGYTTFVCATCGHTYTGDEVAALGHDYDSVVTEPTFEEEGYTTHTCRVCGDVKVDSFVPVLSHTYETVTVDATCTEDGSVTHTCVDCGYSYTEVLSALGHSYETVTTEATCVENGSIVSTCTVCGDVWTEVIYATGHKYETVKIAPTCTQNGYVTYTCACGDVITEEIPATGHSYESSYTAPTCTEAGNTTYTCACGDVLTEAIPALGHTYETKSVAPNCTEAGYTTYTCSACGDSYAADEIAALGHSYNASVIAPTCTEAGYTTFTCSVCSHSYTGEETAALGHNNTSVVTAPTCTEAGYTTYTCQVCGASSVGNEVAALGHSYSVAEENGYLVYTCQCGDTYSEKIENLTYTKVSSISSGNSYVITLYSGRKYYALSHENNQISVTQVTVSGSEITSEITEDLVWNYSGQKLSYEDNGKTYYLYAGSSNNWWGNWWGSSGSTLSLSTSSSSTVSFSNSRLKIGSKYLRYSNGSATLSSSSGTTYFFVEE